MGKSCPKGMDVKRNDDSKEKLYQELAELGADAEAFRMVDPTKEQLTALASALRRVKFEFCCKVDCF